jgi:hypothetical protein
MDFDNAVNSKPTTVNFRGPAAPIVTPNNISANLPPKAPVENDSQQLKTLEANLSSQNNRLSKLEECCGSLAQSTKNLETQLIHMQNSVENKFMILYA